MRAAGSRVRPCPRLGLLRVAPDTASLLSASQRAPTCARPASSFTTTRRRRRPPGSGSGAREDAPLSPPRARPPVLPRSRPPARPGPGRAGLPSPPHPTLPHPAPRAAHSGRPQPRAPLRAAPAPGRSPSLGPSEPSPPTRTEGPGPPSSCGLGLGLLPARQLVPPRPYGAHAHGTATRCPLALTELLPAATLRPSPRLFTAAYPSANAAAAAAVASASRGPRAGRAEPSRGERGLRAAVCLPASGPEPTRQPPACRLPAGPHSTFSLHCSEVGPGGRGTEAGHGPRGRVGERRKP